MANKIDTKTKRERLRIRREPYWAKIQSGRFVGYRRTQNGGTWIARYRDDNGKQNYHALELPEHLPPNEYDAAVNEAREWFKGIQAGVNPKPSTLAAAAEVYLDDLEIRSGPRARADAKTRLDRSILPTFKNIRLDKVTTAQIRGWLNASVITKGTKEEQRKSKATANRNLTTLKAVLNYAHKNGLVGSTLAWDRVKAFGKVEGARKAFLTNEQLLKLINNTSGGFKILVTAASLTGARYGELCALRAKDVDKSVGILHIREGKTGERIVPMTKEMERYFKRLTKSKLPEAYLLTKDDGRPWGHSDQDGLMRQAVKEAKLPREVVFYTLRHSFIAFAISSGMDIYSIAEITGTSVRMIEKHYGKLLKDRVKEAMTKASIISV